MGSEFMPAVRTEETPEARVVIVDLPGFRGKDVIVEVDEQGNLIISGERSVNEMGEITREGGKLDRMQRGGHTFRKVISIPENVNVEDITANLKNQVLRVSLPFVQKNQKLRTEDVNGGPKPHVAHLSEPSKQDERPNPLNSRRRLGYEMESEFEPAVRSEETPEARVVIVDLPGFRRKDVRVQVDDHGNLIISGERSVNEMGEVTKEGGRLDTMQSRGHTFRKVISIPQNVNTEDITAKFKNQVLHVSLPFVQKNHKLLTEDVNDGGKQSKISSPLRQQGLTQERPAATEKHEGARLPEVIRPDDPKAKGNETAEESKAEEPQHAEDIVNGEQPISVPAVEAGSDGDQSKSKQRRIHISSYAGPPSMLICNGGLLVASTLLVLCAAMYIYYILRSRKSD